MIAPRPDFHSAIFGMNQATAGVMIIDPRGPLHLVRSAEMDIGLVTGLQNGLTVVSDDDPVPPALPARRMHEIVVTAALAHGRAGSMKEKRIFLCLDGPHETSPKCKSWFWKKSTGMFGKLLVFESSD